MQAGRLQQGQGLLVFIVLRCPVAGDGEFSNEPARHFWSLALSTARCPPFYRDRRILPNFICIPAALLRAINSEQNQKWLRKPLHPFLVRKLLEAIKNLFLA